MGKFDALVAGEQTYRTLLKFDGKQIVDKDDKPAFIDIHAEDSLVGRRFDKEWRDHLISLAKDGQDPPSQLDHNIAKCAALTAAWHLVDPETGSVIDEPCTRENAFELYSLPMARWIWLQPWAKAQNHANFIRRSAENSSSSQSGNSETAAS